MTEERRQGGHNGENGAPRDGQVPGAEFLRRLAEAGSDEAFYRGWLELQCRTIGGVSASVLVLKAENQRFRPAAFWPEGKARPQKLTEAAERALQERKVQVLKQEAPAGPDGPLRVLHLAQPIRVEGALHGVVALEIGERVEAEVEAALRQLDLGCAMLEGRFARNGNQNGKHLPAAVGRAQAVLELLAAVVEHQRFRPAAMALATEIASGLACDRVSVGFVRRKRVQIRGLSHSAQFGSKTNLIRAIESAMEEAHDQESTIVFPRPHDGEFRITRAHEELAQKHGPGANASIPLPGGPDSRSVGVLTLERPVEKPLVPEEIAFLETAAALVGPALEALRREDRNLIAKAAESGWLWIRKLVGPRHPVLKLVVGGLIALVVFFTFAKGDYRVAAKAVLEGEIQRVAAAPFNSFIAAAPVRAGDTVRAGQVLCVLDDREVRVEQRRLQSQKEQFVKQYDQAMAQYNAAQVKITAAQVEQAQAQLTLVEDQLARMQVTSPIDGIVVKGDLSQAIGAPVERGTVLFEIAPLDRYRLILEVDEREIADVSAGQKGKLLLTALPTEPLPLTVQKVTPVSQAREGRNFFRVEARLESGPEKLRPGLEGIGKVEIDRRRFIWIWTHEAFDWLRLFFWSWTP